MNRSDASFSGFTLKQSIDRIASSEEIRNKLLKGVSDINEFIDFGNISTKDRSAQVSIKKLLCDIFESIIDSIHGKHTIDKDTFEFKFILTMPANFCNPAHRSVYMQANKLLNEKFDGRIR